MIDQTMPLQETVPLEIDGESLTLEKFIQVARQGRPLVLPERALKKMQASRAMLEELVRKEKAVYGITTGFGRFSDIFISREDAVQLQKNLIASHAAAEAAALNRPARRTWCIQTRQRSRTGSIGVGSAPALSCVKKGAMHISPPTVTNERMKPGANNWSGAHSKINHPARASADTPSPRRPTSIPSNQRPAIKLPRTALAGAPTMAVKKASTGATARNQ